MELSLPILRKLCDNSLYHFIRIIGGVGWKEGDITPDLHGKICHFWESGGNRKCVAMPRRWCKTTTLTKWDTIRTYLLNPEERQLIVSENERIAGEILLWIQRQLRYNKRLHRIYADKLAPLTDTFIKKNRWNSTACELPHEGIDSEPSIRAIGVGGAAQSGHYTTIRTDDLVGEEAKKSKAVLEGVMSWFDNIDELLVNPDWTDTDGSVIKNVGTFWASGDFFCYVQEKYPQYEWRIVPAMKDKTLSDESNLLWVQNESVENDESNWPGSKFSTSYYREMRSNPEKQYIYWSQHQNKPRDSEMNKFQKDWLRYYHIVEEDKIRYVVCEKDDGKDGEKFPIGQIAKFGMIDPGGFGETKLTKGSSRCAIVVGGQAPQSLKKFIFYAWADKLKTPETFIDEIYKADDAWKPRTWRIDPFGQQQYIYKDILAAQKRRGKHFSISPLPFSTYRGVKDDDILALVNPWANGEIYIHRTMRALMGEFFNFPNGLTKDILDMIGKLNKYYWSRQEKPKWKPKYSSGLLDDKRDLVTGY